MGLTLALVVRCPKGAATVSSQYSDHYQVSDRENKVETAGYL